MISARLIARGSRQLVAVALGENVFVRQIDDFHLGFGVFHGLFLRMFSCAFPEGERAVPVCVPVDNWPPDQKFLHADFLIEGR